MPKADEKQSTKDFKSDQEVRWCPGCGDYAILAAFQSFLPELEIPRENLVFVSGIGCSSRLPYYVNSYGMHSIHGRAPAIATGLASSRPDLSVWVITGDGDALSIGGNHLIHALRRNVNLKILLFNNRIYGLTKGQYSPTSEQGKVTKSTPFGSLDTPFNPVSLASGAEASFVARTDRLRPQAPDQRAAGGGRPQGHRVRGDLPELPDLQRRRVRCRSPTPGARDEHLIRLEHGEPIRFGADGSHGLRFGRYGSLETVAAAEADAGRRCSRTTRTPPTRPTRSRCRGWTTRASPTRRSGCSGRSPRASYDELMSAQIEAAREQQGDGDLAALLAGSDTWHVG